MPKESIQTLVGSIMNGDTKAANAAFDKVIKSKLTAALETKKVAVASSMFNQNPQEK